MKKYLLSIALILLLTLDVNSHVDHYSKYNYLEYELFRNNKSIGFHKYNFERNGSKLIINNEVSFKPNSLQTTAKPIPVFPAVPSTMVPPLDISFFLIASSTINNAALSFTDSPGFRYLSLIHI